MATTSTRRILARAASSLALAVTATVLSAGYAQADTSIAAPSDTTVGRCDAASTAAGTPGERHIERDRCDAVPPTDTARQAVSVLIIGDRGVFRSGLRAVIGGRADMRYLAETTDAATVPEDIRRLRPDVALLDLDIPGLDAVLTAEPEQTFGSTRFLTFTDHPTDENVYRAMRLGASGFLTKNLSSERLISAIQRTAHEDALLDPRLTRRMMTRLAYGANPFPPAPEAASLTTREHEVLLLVAAAHTNPEIADILGIGEQTVKTHVSNVLAKIGVRDRVQAAVYAHTRRLAPLT
ncbi:LuxR C-terminal-related transcriptional regulator [Nocardia mexicana]|uniref:DNA-binding NarL/FixJ family response regulator n=1 Tax=Nocardia mexicana TaxID=279262 RepID=A0A370HEB2_9NOCA|nr:response regulator transcription factor [Nocardia mexicana]RDI55342.1 DNA-binding NarL/FixJ family response regulator [Nocardia mexicana]